MVALERTFTIRAGESFMDLFAGSLLAVVAEAALGVCLRFAPKRLKDSHPLREGEVDLEIGVPGLTAPELRTQLLFRDVKQLGNGTLYRRPIGTPFWVGLCR